MNSVERLQTALRNEQPDRVPIVEAAVDVKIRKAVMPDSPDEADFMDRMGMDGVVGGATFETVRQYEDGSYEDVWGVTYKPGPELMDHPVQGPIRTMADARAYTPPDPEAPGRLRAFRDLVSRYKGKRAVVFGHRAAFMWSAYLMGLDNLLAAFLVEPELANCVMDKVLEANMAVVRDAIRAGADVVILGDDYAHNAGPLMSPDLFRVSVLPRLTKMIAMIHDEGAFCVKHTDGNIYPLLEMLVSAGPDGVNPFEPVAGMELKKAKELIGGRVCLMGNIDCAHLLPGGTPDEVRETVKQAIADAGEGGGFILSSSNSVHSSCRPENFVAMVEAGREYGLYDEKRGNHENKRHVCLSTESGAKGPFEGRNQEDPSGDAQRA